MPETVPRCEICGAATIERHCKIVCTRCGYTRDCSDPRARRGRPSPWGGGRP